MPAIYCSVLARFSRNKLAVYPLTSSLRNFIKFLFLCAFLPCPATQARGVLLASLANSTALCDKHISVHSDVKKTFHSINFAEIIHMSI